MVNHHAARSVLSFFILLLLGGLAAALPLGKISGSPPPSFSDDPFTFSKREEAAEGHKKHGATFIVEACMIPVLVLISGWAAGMTLGYFSIDMTMIEVLKKTGTPKQREYAQAIEPIRKDSHLLLTTLILLNMAVNETLPIIADPLLGGGAQAIVVSLVLVFLFSELVPQSVCTRYGLVICAKMAWPTKVLIWILYPIAWPISRLLHYVLGAHQGIVYRRGELKELINLHAQTAAYGGDLQTDTVAIVGGALDLQAKTATDAMTPIDRVFMLPITAKLDYPTLSEVVRTGHSRVPVYEDLPDGGKSIVGALLVKQCVLLDPEDATPLRNLPLNQIPSVPSTRPLLDLLNDFQGGRSHMAIVRHAAKPAPSLDDASSTASTDESGKDKDKDGFFHRLAHVVRHVSSSTSLNEKSSTSPQADHSLDARTMTDAQTMVNEEGSDIPEGEPVGLITLEDVIEEVLQEEIWDEYDSNPDETSEVDHSASQYMPAEAIAALAAHKPLQEPLKSTSKLSFNVQSLKHGMRRSSSAPGRRRSADGKVPADRPNTSSGDAAAGSAAGAATAPSSRAAASPVFQSMLPPIAQAATAASKAPAPDPEPFVPALVAVPTDAQPPTPPTASARPTTSPRQPEERLAALQMLANRTSAARSLSRPPTPTGARGAFKSVPAIVAVAGGTGATISGNDGEEQSKS